MLTFLIDP